jgi:DNA polymerase III sliding clamp (beta) subunit (PCNA family)
VNDECDIEIRGEDIIIGFNYRYLYEALKAVKEEKVMINLENPGKSLIMLPCDKENIKDIDTADVNAVKFLYLILPINLDK